MMASINRSLKVGGSDGVECHRALPAQRGRKGETLTSGPHGAVREEGGSERRQAGPTAQREGKRGKGARLTAAERAAPLGHVRAAGKGGKLGHQRPKARGERGEALVQGVGLG